MEFITVSISTNLTKIIIRGGFILREIVKKALVATVFTCIILFLGTGVYAAPYINRTIEFKQPDNSVVTAKVTGDEYYQHVESPDGYTLCRDPETGWICYASLNSDQTELVSSGEIYKGVDNTLVQSVAIQSTIEGKRQKHLEIKSEAIAQKRNKVRNMLLPQQEAQDPRIQ